MKTLKKLSLICFVLCLFVNTQTLNAQTLKAAVEGIDSFNQWATSPDVQMIGGDFNGDGEFTITNRVSEQFAKFAVSKSKVGSGDLNGDGNTDIALLGKKGSGWGSFPITFSNGDGTFNTTNKQADIFYQHCLSADSFTPVVGDFNANQKSLLKT